MIEKVRNIELLKLIHRIKTHSPNLGKLFKRKNYFLRKAFPLSGYNFVKDQKVHIMN